MRCGQAEKRSQGWTLEAFHKRRRRIYRRSGRMEKDLRRRAINEVRDSERVGQGSLQARSLSMELGDRWSDGSRRERVGEAGAGGRRRRGDLRWNYSRVAVMRPEARRGGIRIPREIFAAVGGSLRGRFANCAASSWIRCCSQTAILPIALADGYLPWTLYPSSGQQDQLLLLMLLAC
jgi:hypothetical protein